ncbi:MAG: C45 family peptidase [Burkholderiales bacterium]|nr:C45 family peptidase [Burkholderiales bacterium]
MTIPLIHLQGDPYQRGLTYGISARDQIMMVIEEYKILFEKEAQLTWEMAKKKAMSFNEAVQQKCPDLVKEMEGIAKGCGVDYSVILTLNCRSEIMFTVSDEACTAIAVPPEASGSGKTYLAQNWDWWTIGKGTNIVLEIEQEPLPKQLVVTEAGLVGGKGLNNKSLALTQNALAIKKTRSDGIPLQFILRMALSQTTVPKAIDYISNVPRASAACVGLATADGTLVMLEYAPNNMDVLLSDGNPLCHTNHWLSPIMLADPEISRVIISSTYTRLDWARRLTKLETGVLRKRNLFRILSNHAGFPDGICRHDEIDLPAYQRRSTLFSMVVDTAEKVIWLTDGTPCKERPIGYKLFD